MLAKALADPAYSNGGFLSMQADTMSYADALALVEKVGGFTYDKTDLTPDEALQQEKDLLAKGAEGDMGSFYQAFALHLILGPALGKTGLDVSAEATNTYGYEMESLETTLASVLPAK